MVRQAARRPLFAGNWKMNLNHLEAIALVQKLAFSLDEQALTDVEVAVLPPFTDLRSVQTLVDGDRLLIGYGAQDLSPHESGAYTGDISGPLLRRLGCTYVLAGHSERREHHGEDDEVVNAKVRAAYAHDLVPILCVGEGLSVRQSGEQVRHCTDQLVAALADVPAEQAVTLVVAYEPIWAIGTGEVASPEDAQEVCGALRAALGQHYPDTSVAAGVRILYGGSVKPDNVAAIMAGKDVDGALVGGASLDADTFARVCRFSESGQQP